MPIIQGLVADHLNIWTTAIQKKSSSGRGVKKKLNLYGIKKLRELILELAVRGQLVPQDPNDEPVSVLLEQIADEKKKLVNEGKIKKQKPLSDISEDEKGCMLPEGWQWARLGDIGTSFIGLTYSPREKSGNGVPVLRSSNVQKGEIDLDDIVRVEKEIKKSLFVEPGDLLICARNGSKTLVGKTAMIKELPEPMTFGAFMAIFKSALNSYIEVFLKSPIFRKMLDGVSTTTINQITQSNLTNTVILIPPLPEQIRIVAKVDELMILCDQLEQQTEDSLTAHQILVETILKGLTKSKDAEEFAQNWSRAAGHFDTLFTTEDSIDQLKQTILQLAVMGKLVPQDPNDEAVSTLLEKIAFENKQKIKEGKIKKRKPLPPISDNEKLLVLPQAWEWVRFDLIAENIKNALKAGPFGSALKKSMYVESGYKIYGQEQVISGDENLGDYYIDKEKYQSLESCKVKHSDILISLVGTIGKVLVLSENCSQGIINPRLVKLSLYLDINRKYIQKVLASPLIQNELAEKSHGGTMNILNLGLLRELVFPLPPVAEQQRIVAKVDELMELCDQLMGRLSEAQSIQFHLANTIVEQVVA
jgi:type I restriction enzyme, S subunit